MSLSLNDYQTRSSTTAIYPGAESTRIEPAALSYLALGLGEAGEVQGKVKKLMRDGTLGLIPAEHLTGTDRREIERGIGTRLDREAILAELGDLLWYVGQLADALGASLESVATGNLTKLADRAGRGVLGGSGDAR